MLRRFLRLFLILLIAGCGDGPTAPPTPVSVVRLAQDTATLVPGAQLALTATPLDAQGKPLSRNITWVSSDNTVATVVGGNVTAISHGTAKISATAAGVSGSVDVIVKQGGVLGPAGATLILMNGRVVVVVPAGAFSSTVQLIVDPVTPPVGSPRLVEGTVFSIAAAATIARPFTISIHYDQANLKTGAPAGGLKLYTLTAGKWERVSGSAVDTATRTVSAAATGFGLFAILEQAPGTAEINAGSGQTGAVGASVAVKPSVRVVDTEGFRVPGVAVQFAITLGNGSVSGTSVTTDASGVATIGDWTLGSIVGANKLVATVTGASGGPFEFQATGIAGAATSLKFVQPPPSPHQNRVALAPAITIQLLDAFGNVTAGPAASITASLSSGDGTLAGTLVRQTDATGLATFSDLSVRGSRGSKTIAFSAPPLAGLTALLIVSAGPPQAIALSSGDNQSAIAGSAVSTAPSVRISDADGNPVSGAAVHFAASSGGGSVTGADAVTDASGIAQVGSWTLGTAAGINTLVASSSALTSTATFVANATAGTAGRLALQLSPSPDPRDRIPFATQPVVQVQDAFGNAVGQAGLQVVASLVSGGGQLAGDTVVTTNSAGSATFTNLSLIGTVGPRTLRFTASGISAVSANVTLAAGLPTSIGINGGNNQSAVAGSTVLTPPSVVLKDADNNRVSGVTVVFQALTASGSTAGANQVSDSLGIATLGSWTLSQTAGANTLSATSSVLPGTTQQFTATGIPGPAASIVLVSGGGQTAGAGRGIQSGISFRVSDAFGNAVFGAIVNFAVSGGGSLSQSNATSAGTGIVAASGWQLGPNTGTQSVTATVTGTSVPAAIASATAVQTRIVTFGDSNTDWGFQGNGSAIMAVSYLSDSPTRPSATAPNSIFQLAGKIESQWTTGYSPAIQAVNHGIAATSTGSPRSPRGAPGARTYVNDYARYYAEVLGWAYPWHGGEPVNDNYSGPITRTRAFTPTSHDFAYISMGTNDASNAIQPIETIENLTWMIDRWLQEGHSANHLFLATLSPLLPEHSLIIPEINRNIRALAFQKGVNLIDIASFTSDGDGLTWKNASLHVGDSIHYAESVRDWIATQIVARMAAVTAPPQ